MKLGLVLTLAFVVAKTSAGGIGYNNNFTGGAENLGFLNGNAGQDAGNSGVVYVVDGNASLGSNGSAPNFGNNGSAPVGGVWVIGADPNAGLNDVLSGNGSNGVVFNPNGSGSNSGNAPNSGSSSSSMVPNGLNVTMMSNSADYVTYAPQYGSNGAGNGDDRLDQWEIELLAMEKELNARQAALNAATDQVNADRAALNEAISAFNSQQADLDAMVSQLNADRAALNAAIEKFNNDRASLDALWATLKAAQAQFAADRAALDADRASMNAALDQLAADRATLEADLAAYNAAAAQNAADMESIKGAQDQAAADRAALDAAMDSLAAQQADLDARNQELTIKFASFDARNAEWEQTKVTWQSNWDAQSADLANRASAWTLEVTTVENELTIRENDLTSREAAVDMKNGQMGDEASTLLAELTSLRQDNAGLIARLAELQAMLDAGANVMEFEGDATIGSGTDGGTVSYTHLTLPTIYSV